MAARMMWNEIAAPDEVPAGQGLWNQVDDPLGGGLFAGFGQDDDDNRSNASSRQHFGRGSEAGGTEGGSMCLEEQLSGGRAAQPRKPPHLLNPLSIQFEQAPPPPPLQSFNQDAQQPQDAQKKLDGTDQAAQGTSSSTDNTAQPQGEAAKGTSKKVSL
mmetsp:Transcript_17252/g.47760  ORF Transcript_17252/g.47760 Transcript_17252/m.47760 type:complete len:158 (+) Transcript_17252:90-563(+)|eukprot:CAMPEP_0177239648 /NCGR_PEP_ID=MMETSP0367-20130122/47253_1 /TAXON_ID=447022 ORGANISM="Scrippsiella hangoei-like, Strain SHHI-4" /NCGR_SAMPLE_ID=MMETSP0367 /ASSEMBLY_ACC=CAM_ASM_000362 /LENGTH=157 /DNA_ID=CAMNT_0018690945 /DNA_START=90 /DNA_END=563 /DNA_ORIENTATION=-